MYLWSGVKTDLNLHVDFNISPWNCSRRAGPKIRRIRVTRVSEVESRVPGFEMDNFSNSILWVYDVKITFLLGSLVFTHCFPYFVFSSLSGHIRVLTTGFGYSEKDFTVHFTRVPITYPPPCFPSVTHLQNGHPYPFPNGTSHNWETRGSYLYTPEVLPGSYLPFYNYFSINDIDINYLLSTEPLLLWPHTVLSTYWSLGSLYLDVIVVLVPSTSDST